MTNNDKVLRRPCTARHHVLNDKHRQGLWYALSGRHHKNLDLRTALLPEPWVGSFCPKCRFHENTDLGVALRVELLVGPVSRGGSGSPSQEHLRTALSPEPWFGSFCPKCRFHEHGGSTFVRSGLPSQEPRFEDSAFTEALVWLVLSQVSLL
jgi:hypothetical protein